VSYIRENCHERTRFPHSPTNVGVDPRHRKQKAVGANSGLSLQSEGPADKVKEMLAAVPGAADLIAQARAGACCRWAASWLGETDGHGSWHGVKISSVSQGKNHGYACENGAGDSIDEIVAAIPGCSRVV